MSSIDKASCHGSRESATPANTTASTSALRTMTALRLYLSAQTPQSGTSGMPTTKIERAEQPDEREPVRLGDAHLAQVGRQEREDLADAEALDHRRDPEDRDEDAPVLGRAGGWGRIGAVTAAGSDIGGSLADADRAGDAAGRHTKAPEGTGGTRPFGGSAGSEQVRSPWSPPGPSLAGLAALEPGSRDPPEDRSPRRSGGSHLPLRARRNVRAAAGEPQRAYPRTCVGTARPYPRTCERCGRVVDTRPGGVAAMARLLARLVAAERSLGAPVRRLQPSLAVAPCSARSGRSRTCSTVAGSDTRSTPRSRTSRSACCSAAVILDLLGQRGGGRHRPRGHGPVHARRRRCLASPTTPTPTAPPGRERRPTPR